MIDLGQRSEPYEIALPYGLDDAVKNMRIIDALFRSEKSARFEQV